MVIQGSTGDDIRRGFDIIPMLKYLWNADDYLNDFQKNDKYI